MVKDARIGGVTDDHTLPGQPADSAESASGARDGIEETDRDPGGSPHVSADRSVQTPDRRAEDARGCSPDAAGRPGRDPARGRVRLRRVAAKLIELAALGALIWCCGLPVYVDLAAFLALAIMVARARQLQVACLLASFAVGLGLAEIAVRLTHDRKSAPAKYYRENEKYIRDTGYEPNVDDIIKVPFGDIAAMDTMIADAICEPRVEHFHTDGLGYRNDADYHGQSIVLSGDSFIIANSTDQADMLANVLRDAHGLDAYAIAIPDDPSRYFRRSADILRRTGRPLSILMFIFEGNDFVTTPRPLTEPGAYERMKMRAMRGPLAGLVLPEYVFNVTHRLERMVLPQGREMTEVYVVGGKPMGFFGNYIDAALRPTMELKPIESEVEAADMAAAIRHLRGVFFIPTKFRVYFDVLQPHPAGRSLARPAPGYLATQAFFSRYGVPVIDLTDTLERRARELLPEGRYVYWRDDTHWNGEGIRAAAKVVAEFVRSTEASAGR